MQNLKKCDDVQFTDQKKFDETNGQVVVVAYTLGGVETVSEALALAKESYEPATGRRRFWIKIASGGMDRGNPFNTQSPNALPVRLDVVLTRDNYNYRSVGSEAFGSYYKFLKSNNLVDYRNCVRSL